ncbi:carboxylesterase family protein [Novosphingobium sp. FSY-8]|uniref:Carboxylic ester hydrolase n=1 Tax=Novosphingobium ovatum TaxID=1908523 RepID=A0ABW9XBA8_9SPHN|nr:carboxylesterase/lipase family protein [Novosphingobium ovatum]NBC35817.1 carboxylesterase family protein [Novosphingobium ovatum]
MSNGFSLSRRALMAGAAASTLAARAALAAGVAPDPVVATRLGPVRGRMLAGGVRVFKGLRYAAPPVGRLRFRAPQPLRPSRAIMDAGTFGNAAIQAPGQPDMPADETHGEDCLFLNVWTPPAAKKAPVMVWLHGGGFSGGAASRPTYWGDAFARDGVVLVSVNHRLNVFGYTQLPDSWGPDYASSGLAGMLDIVAALRWVRDNIDRFGGDPANVTIFGESGGGAKVSLLLGMPSAKGLYHKAIIQSGAMLEAAPRAYAQGLGAALTQELGVKPGDVAALAAVPTDKVYAAQDAAIAAVKSTATKGFLIDGFVPSIDGRELPRGPFSPVAQAMAAPVPLIIGTNKDEMTMFLIGDPKIRNQTEDEHAAYVRDIYPAQAEALIPAVRAAYPDYTPGYRSVIVAGARSFWMNAITLAERKLPQGAPVWMYRMDWELPERGGSFKASHALELSFVFGTYDNVRNFVGPSDGPARLSAQMHPAWVAFARTGRPDHAAIPPWPRYNASTRATMIFNLTSHVENDPLSQMRRILQGG